jgi:hypothetical protein
MANDKLVAAGGRRMDLAANDVSTDEMAQYMPVLMDLMMMGSPARMLDLSAGLAGL